MDYEELHRKVTDLYLKGQAESGIQVGDTVRVTTQARGFELGWACEWALQMDDWVGNEYVVKEIYGTSGVKLEDDSGADYIFPFWVLEKVRKSVDIDKCLCKFMPYDKVLVRNCDSRLWRTDIYAYAEVRNHGIVHVCIGGAWFQCIPYEGNEHLNRTTGNSGE